MTGTSDARSEFAEKSAEEVARAYLGWFRRTRACCAIAACVLGVAAVASLVVLDNQALYLLGLVALVGIGVWVRVRVNREFRTLADIINTDCDVEKWRGVIGRIREHDARRRRSRALCDCYLALADLEECRPADALARMEGLDFGRRSVLNVMLHQNRAVCANELGDVAARDASLAALRELAARRRAGSKGRALAERQLASLELSLRPRAAWDPADEARARELRDAAPSHRERASWTLHLAERALLADNVPAARELLDEKDLAPDDPARGRAPRRPSRPAAVGPSPASRRLPAARNRRAPERCPKCSPLVGGARPSGTVTYVAPADDAPCAPTHDEGPAMSFRDNLQHLRATRNMTQEQLAMLLGVSRQSVTKWEAEKSYPEMDKLLKLCQIFECSLDDLVQGDLTGREPDPATATVPTLR